MGVNSLQIDYRHNKRWENFLLRVSRIIKYFKIQQSSQVVEDFSRKRTSMPRKTLYHQRREEKNRKFRSEVFCGISRNEILRAGGNGANSAINCFDWKFELSVFIVRASRLAIEMENSFVTWQPWKRFCLRQQSSIFPKIQVKGLFAQSED